MQEHQWALVTVAVKQGSYSNSCFPYYDKTTLAGRLYMDIMHTL